MKLQIAIVLLLTGIAYAAGSIKSICHVTHLGATDVGITCTNGADPTGHKYGDVLIISCGSPSK